MHTLQERIVVDRAIEDCFRYLVDFSTIEQWDPGVYRAIKTTPGAPEVGSTFQVILNTFGGRKLPMTYELVELEPPHRLRLIGDGDHVSSDDIISLEAIHDHKTAIDYRADLQFQGPISLLFKLFDGAIEKVGQKAVQGLANALHIPNAVRSRSIIEKIADRSVLPAMINFTERGYLKMDRKAHSEYLDGKTAAITGPTGGLGLATACELSRLGADLILVGRTPDKLERAVDQITDFSGRHPDHIDIVYADLADLQQMHRAADQIADLAPELHILINNAGALFDKRQETADGHEKTLAINLICPYVLTSRLLEVLDASRQGRVINVSSGGMYAKSLRLHDMQFRKGNYVGTSAYAHAKRALVDLTDHFTNAHRQLDITFNAMHPGWADTPGVEKSLPDFHQRLEGRLRDPRMGADTIVWLASCSALRHRSGEFFLDRQPRPKALLPNTSTTAAQRRRLAQWLDINSRRPASPGSPKRSDVPK